MIHRSVRNLLRAVSVGSVAVVLLSAAGTRARAQALFQPLGGSGSQSATLPVGHTPQGVAIADFNHDGYPDGVIANKTDNTITLYLSNGAGGGQPPVTYTTCGSPTAVLATDLELSGLPDIVVTCGSSNEIEVFLNQGNGTFVSTPDGAHTFELPTGAGPVAAVSGDFNDDGLPDLAVANSGDGTVTVLLNNAPNLPTVKTLTGLGTPMAIAAGRFTSSGNLDLAVVDPSSQHVHILKGDGAGNFSQFFSSTVQSNPTGIAVGDFNRDGMLDLAVVNAGSGTISILTGNGNDTFSVTNNISIGPATGTGASDLIAMDINDDGNLDLVTGNTLQNDVAVLMGNGNGSFQPVEDYAVPNGPAYLAVGDSNRDGKPDLFVSQSSDASVAALVNNTLPTPKPGGLNFSASTTLTNGNGNMADGIVAADFNHDGFPDIATTYLEDNAVRVLIATGKGQNFNNFVDVYPVGKQPYWVASGDLNNDGFADLVTANTGDKTVSVLMNKGDGSGTFMAAQTYAVGWLPYQVAIGDLNGDEIPDLAVTDYGDNTVSILYGKAGGGFTGGQTLATCTNPYGVAIGDTRHTGQNDIAVTCFHTAQLEVFLNNSMLPFEAPSAQASFQSPEIYTTGSNPTSLVMGDFNRDGNLDIVTGNATANNVSFFGGNGNGTFNTAVDSFALNFPDSIAAGDVNDDGILDLVTVAPNFNQVAILLGKGDGTFQQRVEFAAGQQPWAVALADFDKDGKIDIVTANTVNRVNLTIPAYQTMYMNEFPPTGGGGPSVNMLLNAAGTNITLTQSPAGSVASGAPVTLTATITPTRGSTAPTGTVTFEDTDGTVLGGGPVALSGGTASITVSNLSTGTHQITVLYSGDVLYEPNTASGFMVTVSGTPVVLNAPATVVTGATFSYSVVVGTAGSGAAPVGTASVYAIPPGGSATLVAGPTAVVDNGNGTSTLSGTLTVGPPGTYYGYATFTPTSGGSQAGTSPTITVTVTP